MSTHKKFYSLRKIKGDNGLAAARLDLYGEIESDDWFGDGGACTPQGLLDDLKTLGEFGQLDVHIFSNGGDVFAGLAMYELLNQRSEQVNIYIEGIAASIATIITCAGDKVYIGECSKMMLHNPFTMLHFESMNAIQAEQLAEQLKSIREPMMQAYMKKTGKTYEEVDALLEGEHGEGTWLTAQEAIDFGLADAITPAGKEPLKAAAMIRPGVFAFAGKKIDFTEYSNAEKESAGIGIDWKRMKGVSAMSKKKRKGLAAKSRRRVTMSRKSRRNRAELVELTCPECHESCTLDTDAEEVADGTIEEATEYEARVRRAKAARRRNRAELYLVTCPNCGAEIQYDDEVDDAEELTETVEVEELDAEARRGKASRTRKRKAKARKRARNKAQRALRAELGDDYEVIEDIADEVEDVLEDNVYEIVYEACKEILEDYLPTEEAVDAAEEIAKECKAEICDELPEEIAAEVYDEVADDEETPFQASRGRRTGRNSRQLSAIKSDARSVSNMGVVAHNGPRSYSELVAQKTLNGGG